MSKNDGGPAFPATSWTKDGDFLGENQGMSLRDYFAAKAMQGFMAGHIAYYGHENYWKPSDMAGDAYQIADAMLAERDKERA